MAKKTHPNKKKRDLIIGIILAIVLLVTILCLVSIIKTSKIRANNLENINNYSKALTLDDTPDTSTISNDFRAIDLVNEISVGYNIGNSLDSCPPTGRNDGSYPTSYYETYWGNPVITNEYVTAIKNAGFNTIRLPVTWFYNTYEENNKLVIRTEWLERVAEVVDYCLSNDLYVILDSHHDGDILWADLNDITEVSGNATDLWTQIAEYFKDYDLRLIFESYNELNTKNTSWKYNPDSSRAANTLNQIFVDSVRATGGNNADRILLCGTFMNETNDDFLNSFVLPADTANDKLAISVHSYAVSYNQDINAHFEKLESFGEKQGAPILITEFGSTQSFVPIEYRSNHAGNYIACANKYGIKCFWWDNGKEFRLFDRQTSEVVESAIINSLMNPTEFKTKNISINNFNFIECFSYGAISPTTGALENYDQGALTLDLGKIGFPVIADYGYHINLTSQNNGDGIRLSAIAFYDSHQNLIDYNSLNMLTSYDITPPAGAAYMRFTLLNPWGSRTLGEYTSYLESGDLSLEITEYVK